jgi:hypothetical protein
MHTKLANKKKNFPLTLLEKKVITGCLLGDGTLTRSGRHYRLRVEHSLKHKDYLYWKFNFLKRICLSTPQYVSKHYSYRFGTVGHPEITKFKNDWYKNGNKYIPDWFTINPLIVAIWFMDDGTCHRNTVDFSIHCFSGENDIKKLQKLLAEYNIYTTVNYDGKGKRLYILKKSYPIFKRLVKPYIVKCMSYKLP